MQHYWQRFINWFNGWIGRDTEDPLEAQDAIRRLEASLAASYAEQFDQCLAQTTSLELRELANEYRAFGMHHIADQIERQATGEFR